MTPKTFYPGQEVVCITDEFTPARPELTGLPQPKKNNIYTVLQYVWFKHDLWFMSLKEIDEDVLFSEDAFAPVMERLRRQLFFRWPSSGRMLRWYLRSTTSSPARYVPRKKVSNPRVYRDQTPFTA